MRVSNRAANVMVTIFIVVMSVLAIGIIREVYIKVIEKQCTGWESKPLEVVNRICLGTVR